jgi:hypothetical protein
MVSPGPTEEPVSEPAQDYRYLDLKFFKSSPVQQLRHISHLDFHEYHRALKSGKCVLPPMNEKRLAKLNKFGIETEEQENKRLHEQRCAAPLPSDWNDWDQTQALLAVKKWNGSAHDLREQGGDPELIREHLEVAEVALARARKGAIFLGKGADAASSAVADAVADAAVGIYPDEPSPPVGEAQAAPVDPMSMRDADGLWPSEQPPGPPFGTLTPTESREAARRAAAEPKHE